MRKKQVTIVLCLLLVLAGVIVVSSYPAGGQAQIADSSQTQAGAIPEHVAYEFLFRRATLFRQRAVQAGRPVAIDSALQQSTGLSEEQVRTLDDIAAACLQEVAEQDRRARDVIDQFRARYPGRIVPQGDPLSPPAELEAMERERHAIILRGRARLQQAFGDREFDRLERYMKERYGI